MMKRGSVVALAAIPVLAAAVLWVGGGNLFVLGADVPAIQDQPAVATEAISNDAFALTNEVPVLLNNWQYTRGALVPLGPLGTRGTTRGTASPSASPNTAGGDSGSGSSGGSASSSDGLSAFELFVLSGADDE
jgi:hypothetical protein